MEKKTGDKIYWRYILLLHFLFENISIGYLCTKENDSETK